jgi:hypothetical protein
LLDLGATQVSDAGLENLKGLTQLQSLDLGGTRVTDAGLNDLKRLTQLKNLFLWRTTVTNEGVKRLQKALPNCIIHGGPDLPRIMETGAP